jgi:hypothetical protein
LSTIIPANTLQLNGSSLGLLALTGTLSRRIQYSARHARSVCGSVAQNNWLPIVKDNKLKPEGAMLHTSGEKAHKMPLSACREPDLKEIPAQVSSHYDSRLLQEAQF